MKEKKAFTLPNQRLLIILAFVLSAISLWAQGSIDYKCWMANLPDSTRLSTLSIPCAHDAATWYTSDGMKKDQSLTEAELFDKGVRAFDMRINSYNGGHMMHGDLISNWYCSLASFDEEIKNLPTSEQLGKECIFFFIDREGMWASDSIKRNEEYKAFVWFMKRLIDRYGEKKFVAFKKTMRLDSLRGKVMVFVQRTYLTPKLVKDSTGYDIPINFTSKTEYTGSGDMNTLMELKNTGETVPAEDIAEGVHQDKCGSNDKIAQKEEYVTNAIQAYWKMIDVDNTQNIFNYSGLNGWRWEMGGLSIAADDKLIFGKQDWGMNHWYYDFLKDKIKPLGMVAFDFCGTNSRNTYDTYGNLLLQEIIQHNYLFDFVKEIAVCAAETAEAANKALADAGYSKVTGKLYYAQVYQEDYNGDLNYQQGTKSCYIFVGCKYTNDPSQALSDVALVRFNSDAEAVAHPEVTINNKTYQRVEALSPSYSDFHGNTNYSVGGKYLYLYTLKENLTRGEVGQKLLRSTTVLVDNTSKTLDELYNPVHLYDYSNSGCSKNSDYGDFNYGAGGRYIYMQQYLHTHTADEQENGYDSISHYTYCTGCNMKMTSDYESAHTFSYKPSAGEHIVSCSICGYNSLEECMPSGAYDNGISTCSYCGTLVFEPSVLNDTVYEISNAGQLYWFANKVNQGNSGINGRLMKDISVNADPTSDDAIKWMPIGYMTPAGINSLQSYIDSINVDYSRYSNTYRGTFDGNGHTISGLKIDNGTIPEGLFCYIKGGTVKKLGIRNTDIKIANMGGTFAGRIVKGRIEDVYSDATIHTTGKMAGAMAGYMNKTTLKNSYFAGTFDKADTIPYVYAAAPHLNLDSVKNYFCYYPGSEEELYDVLNNEGSKDNVHITKELSAFRIGGSFNALDKLNDGRKGSEMVWYQSKNDDLPRFATEKERMTAGDSTPTAVKDIECEQPLSLPMCIYNISGQKVCNGYKGIVIINGKKVIK